MDFVAAGPVRDALTAIGRTEDLSLSPDGSCLAVAAINADSVLLLNLSLEATPTGRTKVGAASSLLVTSPSFHAPHGVAWIDGATIAVANRSGGVSLVAVPHGVTGKLEAHPFSTLGGGDLVATPGSVSVAQRGAGLVELLVCNNYSHNVSRHLLDAEDAYATVWSETLLTDGLNVPDGVTHSRSGRWIAISNHYDHSVLIYGSGVLAPGSKPAGVLRGVAYPHGLRFTPDERAMLVADAGAPVVHIFGSPSGDWRGTRLPGASIEVVPADAFQRGNVNVENGGPKGLELLDDGRVLVVTCEEQPLALFDVAADVERVLASMPNGSGAEAEEAIELSLSREFLLARLKEAATELARLRAEVQNPSALSAEHAAMIASLSWRITAPLRRGKLMLTRLRDRVLRRS